MLKIITEETTMQEFQELLVKENILISVHIETVDTRPVLAFKKTFKFGGVPQTIIIYDESLVKGINRLMAYGSNDLETRKQLNLL